jgi:acid phosphatase family membrane protein YuiD
VADLALAFNILARDNASRTFSKVGDSAEKSAKRTSGAFAGVGKALFAGVAAFATVDMFKSFITEAEESRRVGRLTAQVIKSTGGAAKITAAQVGNLATAISNKTGIDDEAIQSGANLLLTFTGIRNEVGKGNDIFNQATQTITDMSAALGQDTKASAIQLGKALNDPIKGVTALQRVGVSFTESQKKQIKSLVDHGKTLEAQKVILKELGREFGGAAAAAASPSQKLGVIFGNLKESIGTALLPIVDK